MNWPGTRVLVTGGASCLGSTLVDALVQREARVRVVDNLTSGRLDNLRQHLASASIEFIEADLLDPAVTNEVVEDIDVVFHLAASHDRCATANHRFVCSASLMLDASLFRASAHAGVEKVILVSSGENGPASERGNFCARMRRTAELALQAYAAERVLKTASCRYFSVYGERAPAHHAAMALVARTVARQKPFISARSDQQGYRWTHVRDVVAGFLLAAEHIEDGRAVDLETPEYIPAADAIREIRRAAQRRTTGAPQPSARLAPSTRSDTSLAAQWIGWVPAIPLSAGLRGTIDWYRSTLDADAACACDSIATAAPPSSVRRGRSTKVRVA